MPPITLTTDFGVADTYVAQMKGVILGIRPDAVIIDATHAVPPQDVRRAAWLIADLADAFPPGSVHVAVVDPGVGTPREILAAEAGGQFYLAPDNGLLTLVLDRHADAAVFAVTNPRFRRKAVSATFHGRDLFAPAAAALASGVAPRDLGPPPSSPPLRLAGLAATVAEGRIVGAVAWADRFGNLVTNVPATLLDSLAADRPRTRVGPHVLHGLHRCYADVPAGALLALVGSSGRLEIALNGGDAAATLHVAAGEAVVVEGGENQRKGW